MATDRDRASFEHWHIQRQRSRGYGAFLSDAEFVTRDESGRYRTLGLDDALEAWCAALASAPAAVHPLMAPEALCKTIGELLGAAMDQAVKNGANSVSMPDEYVALAAWLCETPAAPQPAEPAQPAPQAGAAEPVAWMHDEPGRVDVIHHKVKELLEDQHAKGYSSPDYMHRPLGKVEHYTIPLYAHPTEQPSQDAKDAAKWREHVGKLDALVAFCPTCCEGKVASADMTRDEVIFQCGRTSGKSEAARAAQAQGGAK